jgi:predicted nucleic acid-binding protein
VTLVDTNVLIDIVSPDPNWFTWSRDQLERLSAIGPLFVNDVIYAELSARFRSEVLLRESLEVMDVTLERLPHQSLFPAGRAFGRYRAGGGPRTSLIADFLIGAHAAVMSVPILTRDPRRYRTYFPGVELITPS